MKIPHPLYSQPAAKAEAPRQPLQPFGGDGLGFDDLIDAVNPLHHLPGIGLLYRQITQDTIAPAARLAGGALFGGPIGAGVSALTMLVENAFRSTGANAPSEPSEQIAASTLRNEDGYLVHWPGQAPGGGTADAKIAPVRDRELVAIPPDSGSLRGRVIRGIADAAPNGGAEGWRAAGLDSNAKSTIDTHI